MRDRFINEAKVMVQLNHPNIRKVIGFGNIDDRPAIIMEYLDGNDLKARMKQGQRFTGEELKTWWNQLASALNYTHKKGIVHRDIKPSNIFVDEEGNVKLLDFGIAKAFDTTSGTLTGSTLGTRIYMSPEQVRDPKRVGLKSDVYSLAVSYVHLLTGKAPYDTRTSSDYDIQESIVRKPLDLSTVPSAWRNFLMPYLEKDPAKRPELKPFEGVSKDDAHIANVIADDEGTVADGASSGEGKKGEVKGRHFFVVAVLYLIAVAILSLLAERSFHKEDPIPPDPDTEAFMACQTVGDYRNYMLNKGRESKHYAEAKEIVDKHVADSTAQAQEKAEAEQKTKKELEKKEDEAYKKCTTVSACNQYLKDYPQGRYVEEVKVRKAELEAGKKVKQDAKQEAEKKAEVKQASKSGAFSVSPNKKVYFAEGNLQYQASTNSWRFAPNPWDCIGEGNNNISPSYSGWIDLFGWGTGNDPTKTSSFSNDYLGFSDWGLNLKGKWHTLSSDEWEYVFDKRNTTSGIRYAMAEVNGVKGVILLPDDWKSNIYTLGGTNLKNAGFASNRIGADKWNAFFAPAGAIFLPACGQRLNDHTSLEGKWGFYWSSSEYYDGLVYVVNFSHGSLNTKMSNGTSWGYSVRLVCPAE